MQVRNFPTGRFSYTCSDNDGAYYTGSLRVSDPNQRFETGTCLRAHDATYVFITINGVRSNDAPW